MNGYELCEYWEGELKELPDGKLVSPNGFSPEHGPTEDGVHDGNRAYKLLSEMLQGNFAANLYDFCPPFQIDGNFGYASGVCEMLVQSHLDEIHLLPALPDAWPEGSVQGIKARGGFDLDIYWKNGKMTDTRLRSNNGGACKVRLATPVMLISQGQTVPVTSPEKGVIVFETQKGREYLITPGRG